MKWQYLNYCIDFTCVQQLTSGVTLSYTTTHYPQKMYATPMILNVSENWIWTRNDWLHVDFNFRLVFKINTLARPLVQTSDSYKKKPRITTSSGGKVYIYFAHSQLYKSVHRYIDKCNSPRAVVIIKKTSLNTPIVAYTLSWWKLAKISPPTVASHRLLMSNLCNVNIHIMPSINSIIPFFFLSLTIFNVMLTHWPAI